MIAENRDRHRDISGVHHMPVRLLPSRHMVYPRDVAMAVPLFPRPFRPSNRRKRWIAQVMAFVKLVTTFFCADSVVFARYSDFRHVVVCVCFAELSMVPRWRRGRLVDRALSQPYVLRGHE